MGYCAKLARVRERKGRGYKPLGQLRGNGSSGVRSTRMKRATPTGMNREDGKKYTQKINLAVNLSYLYLGSLFFHKNEDLKFEALNPNLQSTIKISMVFSLLYRPKRRGGELLTCHCYGLKILHAR